MDISTLVTLWAVWNIPPPTCRRLNGTIRPPVATKDTKKKRINSRSVPAFTFLLHNAVFQITFLLIMGWLTWFWSTNVHWEDRVLWCAQMDGRFAEILTRLNHASKDVVVRWIKRKKNKNPLSAHWDRASVCNIGQMALRSSRSGPFTLVVRLASSFGNITEEQHPVNPSALTQAWKDIERRCLVYETLQSRWWHYVFLCK